MKQRLLSWFLLAVILAVGIVVRARGAWWDMPYHYDVDEPFFVDRALTMLRTGDFNPYWFGHPGTVWIYLLTLVFGGIATVGGYGDALVQYPEITYGVARGFNIAIGTLTAVLVYMLARRLSLSRWVSLGAALIMAVAPLHVEHSRLARTDILATFLILLAFVVITKVQWKQQWWQPRWLMSGVVAGLAVATKYPAALAGLTLAAYGIIGHILQLRGSIGDKIEQWFGEVMHGKTPLMALGLGGILGFTVGTPYFWLNLPIAFMNIAGENRTVQLGHERLAGLANYVWYFRYPLVDGIGGVVLALLAAVGIAFVVVRYRRQLSCIPVILFPALYILFIGSLNLRWERWVIPVLPFEALFAALGAQWIWQIGVSLFKKTRLSTVFGYVWAGVLIIGVLLLVGNSFNTSYAQGTALLERTDTRTKAKEWIDSNLPAGSVIVYEEACPRLEVHSPTEKQFVLINKSWKSVFDESLEQYRSQGVNYIIVSTWVQHELVEYNVLREQARYVYGFGNGGDVTQPEIEIFELTPVGVRNYPL